MNIENEIMFPKCHSALDAESRIEKKWILACAGMTCGVRMTSRNRSGLTFVELLVALTVSSIIFAAVASLAFAVGAANDSSTEMSESQARIRFATIRIKELIKNAKMVTLSGSDDLAIWKSDSDNDSEIDPAEVVFIEAGSGRDHIWFLQFPNTATGSVALASLKDGSEKTSLISSLSESRIEIIPQCSNVTFWPVNVGEQDNFVSISFNVVEDTQTRYYQISSKLMCRADNLIDGAVIVSGDDD